MTPEMLKAAQAEREYNLMLIEAPIVGLEMLGTPAAKWHANALREAAKSIRESGAFCDAMRLKKGLSPSPGWWGTPDCARCGHAWSDHRVIWEPYMSFKGPCTFPSKPNSWERDPKVKKPPCACPAYAFQSEMVSGPSSSA